MGQIKFRVWVKEGTQPQLEGRLLPVESLEWDTKGQTLLYVISHDGNGGRWEVEIKNCKLMQYTGLHDKDGVEIYEGDIVRYRWGGTLSYGIIKWNMDNFSCNKGWFISCWCGTPPYGYDCENISWDKLEVVGNTYEDADFLETIKYGVTNGDKPRTRDGIKSIIMTSLKKERRSFNGWIPSQVNISQCGIMDSALGNELRDELVAMWTS